MKNNKVVYIHKKASNGEVFYVGIGNHNRPHVAENRSAHWNRTVNKHGIDICIIKRGLSWEEACDIEFALISFYGRKDKGLGNLVNLTDGGEGAVGGKGRSREVLDIKSNLVYGSLKEACDSLSFKLTTVAEQLRRGKVQYWNTLRFLDCKKDLLVKKRKDNTISHNTCIDVKTNKIYKNSLQACEDLGISNSVYRQQVCKTTSRARTSVNTIHKLNDLVVFSDGYLLSESN